MTRRPCNVETTTIPPNQRKSDAPPCERRRNKQYPAPSPRKSDARASVATTTSPRSPRRKTQLIIMLSKRIGKLLEAAYSHGCAPSPSSSENSNLPITAQSALGLRKFGFGPGSEASESGAYVSQI